jgi:hypothetical protein
MFFLDKEKACAAMVGGQSEIKEEKQEIEPDFDQAVGEIGQEVFNAFKTNDAAAFSRSLASLIRILREE